jgi:predicted metal-dependent RNase
MSRIDINGILTSHEVIEAVYPEYVVEEVKDQVTKESVSKRVLKYFIRFKSGIENEINEDEYKAIRAAWTS